MTKSLSRVLLTLALAAPLTARAQTGDDAFRFAQRSALSTAQSLGNAGVGVAGRGDLGDLFGNPAGLGLMQRGAFSIGLNASNAENESIYSVGGGSGFARSSEQSATRMGNLSYVYKAPTARGSLVFGAGLAQVASFNRTLAFEGENGLNSFTDFLMPLPDEFEFVTEGGESFPEFSRPLSFIGYETYAIDWTGEDVAVPFAPAVSRGTVLQSGLVQETGGISQFTIGGAFEASRDVMVGFSFNVPYGRYEFTRLLDEDDFLDDNDGTGGTTDFGYLEFTEGFESRMVGVNLKAGVSAKVNPKVRLGLSVETPTFYTIQEDYDTVLFTSFDNGDAFEYGDDFDEDAGRGSFDYEVRTPWRLEAGVAYDAPKFALAADLEFVDWSQLELSSDGFSFSEQNLAIRQNYESATNLRLGGTYRFDKVHLRAGLAGMIDPRPEAEGISRDRGVVSLGLSYLVNNQFAFDLGVMAEAFEDAYRPYREVADAPLVTEEVLRSYLTLGVRVGL